MRGCGSAIKSAAISGGSQRLRGGMKMKNGFSVKEMTIGGIDISEYAIIYPKDGSVSLRKAAELLARMIQKATGHGLAVMDDTQSAGHEIVLDTTGRDTEKLKQMRASVQRDGYALLAEGGRLYITGTGARGTRNGIFAFLEARLGFRFYTKDDIVVRPADKVEIPEGTGEVYSPRFEYRETYWLPSYGNMELSSMQRINGKREGDDGINVEYALFVHTLSILLDQPHQVDYQPCLSDEKVYRKILSNVRKKLDENPYASIISVSQNDSYAEGRGCQCEKCRAIDEAEGTPMGSLLTFVNRIADAIKDDYPHVAVDTLAYRYTRKAPKTIVPADNVIIRLCSVECDCAHPISDADIEGNVKFKKDIEEWARICKRLYVWDYTTNFPYYLAPFPNLYNIYDNMQFFKDHHVVGLFEQGNAESPTVEFGELRGYLISRLMWNPDISREEYLGLMDEFLQDYYGAGWRNVREYIDRTTARAAANGFELYTRPDKYLAAKDGDEGEDIAFWNEMLALWDRAVDMAETAAQKNHVRQSRLQVEFYLLYAHFDHQDRRYEAFYRQLKEFGVKTHCEGGKLPEVTDFSQGPGQWYAR